MSFVHLHNHTAYSLLDGSIKIKQMLKRAKELEMPAVAITDHGNMFGVLEFYVAAKEAGIKPIIGCEAYITSSSRLTKDGTTHHLVLLAQNLEGYRNLSKLISAANREGFYHKPRIDKEILHAHSSGLIGLSACLAGEIPSALLKGDLDHARHLIGQYQDIFQGRFYLEIQENGIEKQVTVNEGLVALSQETGVSLVATNDCHYLNREDAEAHEVLLCVQTGKTMGDPSHMKYETTELYFKSPAEMAAQFYYAPEAVSNTVKIAEQCDLSLDLKTYHFPTYEASPGKTLEDDLWGMAISGMAERWPLIAINNPSADKRMYFDRLKTEFECIKQMGFVGYFLVVADFIRWAKAQGIPVGPGRGSAAGSLIAYAIKITDLDPIPYNLLFERFLNPERISMPDIDVDFCQSRRGEVIKYVTEKYGRDKVCQIITFGSMNARGVIRDVGRALDMAYGEVDKIAKLVPEQLEMTLEKALSLEHQIQKLMDEDHRVKYLVETALKLEGLPRHASTHAAGVVIAPTPLEEYLPLYKDQKSDSLITQFNMKWVEKMGLVKFDFLGLRNLTIIDHTVKLIRVAEPEFAIERLPFSDQESYKLLQGGYTTGVFQLESGGMKGVLTRLKPTCFEDVIAVCALYRPGPLGSGMVDEFIERKHGRKEVSYPHPALEPILKDTYGVIVYQEQVMQIAQVLAGYTLGGADLLRRAMGKKIKEEMEKQRAIFCDGAIANGVDSKLAGEIFDLMEKFAEYGFNKSHSAAYALIAYQTAYLKAHYPLEFMAALLTADMDNTEKVLKNLNECREMGITILPPDVNSSGVPALIENNAIRLGFGVIKGVGEAAVESITEVRNAGGPFKDIFDFCERVDLRKVNKKVQEVLVKAGAFDTIHPNRAQVYESLETVVDYAQRNNKDSESTQMTLFSVEVMRPRPELYSVPDWDKEHRLLLEKEALGFFVTGHPLDDYVQWINEHPITNIADLGDMEERSRVEICGIMVANRETITKKGDKMAIATLEDLTGTTEVLVFPEAYRNYHLALVENTPLVVVGFMSGNDQKSVIANSISPLAASGG